MEALGCHLIPSKCPYSNCCPPTSTKLFPSQFDLISLDDPLRLALRQLTYQPVEDVLEHPIRVLETCFSDISSLFLLLSPLVGLLEMLFSVL